MCLYLCVSRYILILIIPSFTAARYLCEAPRWIFGFKDPKKDTGYTTPKIVSRALVIHQERDSNDRISYAMPGRRRSTVTFINHDGNGIATGTNTRAQSHDGHHRIITANDVSRRSSHELEIGEGERICRLVVVAEFCCWSYVTLGIMSRRWRWHSSSAYIRTGHCRPYSITVVL